MNERGLCHLSCIAVRNEPSHRSEMVSQLIYGERYTVIEYSNNDWLFIECEFDKYRGFLPVNQFNKFNFENTPLLYTGDFAWDAINNFIPKGAEIFDKDCIVDVQNDELMDLSLIQLNNEQIREKIFNQSTSMINTPYLWGGRTAWGMDCSGFTQIIYKVCGINLLRDASEQQQLGELINNIEEILTGDIAFFCNESGNVTHTGIALSSNSIIHCSGSVKVDILNNEGIICNVSKNKTHTLHSIKRVIT